MWNVVIAMIPALIVSIYVFGLSALWVVLISVGASLLTEWAIDKFMFKRTPSITNGSALITGMLLAFNLPNILPWWMVVIGAVVAIGVGKMSFGGLGCNIWNPALVGRVFLLLSFPAAMTTRYYISIDRCFFRRDNARYLEKSWSPTRFISN